MNSISKKIYEEDPKEPKSIQIQFSEDEIKRNEDINSKIFRMLLEIFHDGMKKFYSKDNVVNLDELNDDNFLKIRKYFWSIGFEVFYQLTINKELVHKNDSKDKKSDLKDYYVNLTKNESVYQIYFDYY
tara:strand:- start:707 stop:1093 length:387 start_codon:yes stop_codon:yes gene_type:complete